MAKSSKFGIGMLFGMVAGALAGLFLSPNTGKKNRTLVLAKIKKLEKQLKDKDLDKKVKAEIKKDIAILKDKLNELTDSSPKVKRFVKKTK